ncbi:CidA/LrgA family protein [Bacilliculturomica massiliensis]|uniref:CidA/LrgA family protein n=1 Tax=Bacilliculturomica massiliensis TaxID=1917867 RepID=UPI0010323B00|nr:CidA/LrgA family protein [Bacilliculturomica massiliensis]
MKYLKQLLIIFLATCIGEMMRFFIPLPIPAGIYGMVIMLLALITGIVKLENVKETGEFLIEIMPVMFIPPAVGLIDTWGLLSDIFVPVIVITVISTFVVMIVTGKLTDLLLSRSKGGADIE